ncbi:MarR family winged helix-turn-helix transcriptional regulator [Photobacterium sp. TY1-4]|uniref:MarR family winged helix-turn-helix transcriptional regulator n=1 Tax=Photobacterium sp. TY1-4 TaxID=2899122 RepID=UPI0021C10662|nr:MarR family winged helix-turn-helix transcriptional regulator [Photobacterium sp. TY1-4]UXI03620.1 MarR family winged helix-turn-helix transcriptional regulator [Photobacterium sp. TY1-4]
MSRQTPITESIWTLSHHYRVAIRKAIQAKELGLNGMVVRCLHIIDGHPQCTANVIVQTMARDKAQIARLVKEMMALNLIEKQPNPDDKRSHLLALTGQGAQLVARIRAAELALDQQMRRGISEDDLSAFRRVSRAMADNIRNIAEDSGKG